MSLPSGWMRRCYRAPIWLYRAGFGWLFRQRLMLLAHRGRATGRRREVVVEVAARDGAEIIVVSGWGERSDWYRNLRAGPALEIRLGRRRYPAPEHRFLNAEETVRLLIGYREHRPWAWWFTTRSLGLPPDPVDAASTVRAVAFRLS